MKQFDRFNRLYDFFFLLDKINVEIGFSSKNCLTFHCQEKELMIFFNMSKDD